ncbi:hypothetical protein CLAFUW4_06203 [Fulvia fulva]|uniref:Uncharacterized protein n=1 Tax=Passalora fulva TaxID=5499 RepID=A0A9Q8LKE3_PASFU|nr:uncharacterized protein CLAFUR5_06347 [Fulvia fulva]KAK4624583.1 hypothetical protein CLAFUR4_06206 [Fulvia fulva]KAK4624842.1 hypothetical protein CLAFUR0_06210 [Fulvia fulva]UJO18353.1 hypothetical protein CLAFUR5_06347 [Fulvia fulva]WPV15048.1 hypothetical protein CLAFUW4_06203 [Fulvia fulva]WPV29529.1 hypothetical protein CLAFUW7_06199 [Fulvia fulva]
MAPIILYPHLNTHHPLFLLPQEIQDLVFSFVFSETNLDISTTRDAELRIFEKHLILRRTWPVPPPSWKGCRNVFRTCKVFYANGLDFLYSQMSFSIRINGDDDDPGQTRSRLHSDYPFGRLDECLPLQYLRRVHVSMSAGSIQDLVRLETRVKAFDVAVKESPKLCVTAIRLSLGRLFVTETVFWLLERVMGIMLRHCSADGMQDEQLFVKIFSNPGNDIPELFLRGLAQMVRKVGRNASVVSYSKGMVLL